VRSLAAAPRQGMGRAFDTAPARPAIQARPRLQRRT
jgi:hypothetical protein